jgi:hypothetical protein
VEGCKIFLDLRENQFLFIIKEFIKYITLSDASFSDYFPREVFLESKKYSIVFLSEIILWKK